MNKGFESVEKEIAGEKAAALGRSARKLRSALDKLRRFDESSRRSREVDARARLVEGAGEALWAYVVQREAVGLIDSEYIRKEYAVPADVWQHMRPRMEAARSRSLSD